ncbi:hypothetical protein J18TS1_06020 [Oceanobacillus oncorhynchi subsp. incaldanensis]|nr:hypothetical protein J18TS1_06020 [Oceanobacillus oncorhynchi subsp. incaldanensis]
MTYIPIEKITIFHGAFVITFFAWTAGLRLAKSIKIIAIKPAMMETGICIHSLVKYPIINKPRTYQDKRKSYLSLIASAGSFNLDKSYLFTLEVG